MRTIAAAARNADNLQAANPDAYVGVTEKYARLALTVNGIAYPSAAAAAAAFGIAPAGKLRRPMRKGKTLAAALAGLGFDLATLPGGASYVAPAADTPADAPAKGKGKAIAA